MLPGDTAPAFTLYDADKKERSLSEFLVRGKKTILAFYPGAFTGVCTQELRTFRDMFSELERMNALLVAVSVNMPFAQKTFAEKYGFKFPLLCDLKREATRKYDSVYEGLGGVAGYESSDRAIFILGDSGKVQYAWIAPNPSVLPDFGEIRRSI